MTTLINENGKSYGAGYAVANAICDGASATVNAANKTAGVAVGATAVVVLGTAVVTTAAAGAAVRGTKHAAYETAEVSTSFLAGFGRAFKDRAAQRKETKRAAAEERAAVMALVDNVVAMKPRVRVINGQMVEVLE